MTSLKAHQITKISCENSNSNRPTGHVVVLFVTFSVLKVNALLGTIIRRIVRVAFGRRGSFACENFVVLSDYHRFGMRSCLSDASIVDQSSSVHRFGQNH